MMLMIFHAVGALVFIPALVSLMQPKFALDRQQQHEAEALAEAEASAAGS